ncbi:MAG TPA: DUF4180 domain-containing protein [Bacteroidales bacterium]|nr:DUF4180 domain-containing protein [Bacteroidales bacterium]
MEIKIFKSKNINYAEIISDEIIINNVQDALDLMANCRYQGSENLIMYKYQFKDEFFDLKTGIAGEILQKFSNYSCRLAIIGDFLNVKSKSLSDFIYESNKGGRVVFAVSIEDAIGMFS